MDDSLQRSTLAPSQDESSENSASISSPKKLSQKKSLTIFLTMILLVIGILTVITVRSTEFRGKAAETNALEVENAQLNNGATSGTDGGASNNSYVQF